MIGRTRPTARRHSRASRPATFSLGAAAPIPAERTQGASNARSSHIEHAIVVSVVDCEQTFKGYHSDGDVELGVGVPHTANVALDENLAIHGPQRISFPMHSKTPGMGRFPISVHRASEAPRHAHPPGPAALLMRHVAFVDHEAGEHGERPARTAHFEGKEDAMPRSLREVRHA